MFVGVDNTRGCIGGPHKLFEACERQFLETSNVAQFRVFLQQQVQLFNTGIRVCLDSDVFAINHEDVPSMKLCSNDVVCNDILLNENQTLVTEPIIHDQDMLGHVCSKCGTSYPKVVVVDADDPHQKPLVMLFKVSRFIEAENAGSKIDYRCVKCRSCSDCRNGELIEKTSLKEEVEQDLIEDTIEIDLGKKEAIAYLPFTVNPDEKLKTDEKTALKVYRRQTKLLHEKPKLKADVLESEAKLQKEGYVDWLKNLPLEIQQMIMSATRYLIPWRFVQNPNSVTTPTRVVFDASLVTESGFALNDVLAKGIKSLNSMLGIYLSFRCWRVALHTDAKKLYNHVKLRVAHWRFQLYYWHENLDISEPPELKVIKTLIYGLKSSGNQAECALRMLAELLKDKYPEAARAIIEDTYMDDTVTGASSIEDAEELASDLTDLLGSGGFSPKGYTRSGRPPLPTLSKDGVRIGILGSLWSPEKDEIQLAIGTLNFSKKYRGKKTESDDSSKVPKKLTKRICAGKVAEMFDLSGLASPLTGGFKLDLHDLHLSYGWDDPLSDLDRTCWIENFKSMSELSDVMWSRAVIPENACSTNIELIGTGDASEGLACAACYIRFECSDGSLSCQLILAKTKIVNEDRTLPQAELLAAALNTHVTEVVKKSLKNLNIAKTVYVLDSEIALHWIGSKTKPLKPWVRNRVIEISRFTEISQWFHVESELNPADVGTRKGANIDDISRDSKWINGEPWMRLPLDELRGSVLKDINDVKLRAEHLAELKKEQMKGTDLCKSDYHLVVSGDNNESVDSRVHAHGVHVTLPNSHAYVSEDASEGLVSIITERLKFSRYLIDPNRYTWSKVMRIMALVIKMSKAWMSGIRRTVVRFSGDEHELTSVAHNIDINDEGSVALWYSAVLSDADIQYSQNYFFRKGTEEIKIFVQPNNYENISVERDGER